MAAIDIINIFITSRTKEGFELRIFIRNPSTGISYETGVSGNRLLRYNIISCSATPARRD
jgi:hypothetical protein